METANYFQNRLPTKTESHGGSISEEKYSNKRQNVSHIKIFSSKILVDISKKKKNKSDYQHVWKEIFIGFSSNTNKYYQI